MEISPRELRPFYRREELPSPTAKGERMVASSNCVALAVLLQEAGRFDEARECLEHAIELDERNGPAWYALVQAGKVISPDWVARMTEALLHAKLSWPNQSHLHFALGKALDDLGDHESSMRHFDEGNRLMATHSEPFNRDAFERDVTSVIKTYTAARMKDLRRSGSPSDLPILIVGMVRSGTTLVEQILSSHPQVADGGELSFWRQHGYPFLRAGSHVPSPHEVKRLTASYSRVLRAIDPAAARVTDKMPQNFMAAGLALGIFPNARILACRRNPADTCLSIYMTLFREGLPFANTREDIVFFYRQYLRLMEHWRATLPDNRLTFVDYEAWLSDRESITRRLVDFCGLPWADACLRPEENRRLVRTASVWQVRQGVYGTSVERWRRYEPWLGSFAELLSGHPTT